MGNKESRSKQKLYRFLLNVPNIAIIFDTLTILGAIVSCFIPSIFFYTIIPACIGAIFEFMYIFNSIGLHKVSTFAPNTGLCFYRMIVTGGICALSYFTPQYDGWWQVLFLVAIGVLFLAYYVPIEEGIRTEHERPDLGHSRDRARVLEDIRKMTVKTTYYTYDTSGDKVKMDEFKKKLA